MSINKTLVTALLLLTACGIETHLEVHASVSLASPDADIEEEPTEEDAGVEFVLQKAETHKLPLGTACQRNRQCGSGHCVHTRCCESECEGQCARCDYMDHLGYCTVMPAGTVGWPACAPMVCDGESEWCVWPE